MATAATVFRNYETDGVPSSGAHQVKKGEVRTLLGGYEQIITAFLSNGGLIYASRGSLFADLAHPTHSSAWVIGDTTVAYNGVYMKNGASGTGSWTRVADLPYSFIIATDVGAGTPNAIQAATSIPVSGLALVWLNIADTNGQGPTTVQFNSSGPIYTIKTNSGNDPVVGGLVSGMIVMGIVSGATFRLISDQASAAILAQVEGLVSEAEAARDAAADYANFARNNWAAIGPFVGVGALTNYPLTVDPGSPNNMFVIVGGNAQLITQGAYSLVYSGGNPFIRINVPADVSFEVRVSNAIPVNTPADGSVTTVKLADGSVTTAKHPDDSVTYAKMQNISAALRLLGRDASGAGDPQELTAAQLRDLFLPAGSVIDSVVGSYTTNADITGAGAVIPGDDTIPQITEGVQIISVSITPKSTANKLRIRVSGSGSVDAVSGWAWAVFSVGTANAIMANSPVCALAGAQVHFGGEVDLSPGSIAAQTITLRVGVVTSTQKLRLNVNNSGRLFGGVAAVRLVVEEIKG